jgi:hypothetical protein
MRFHVLLVLLLLREGSKCQHGWNQLKRRRRHAEVAHIQNAAKLPINNHSTDVSYN